MTATQTRAQRLAMPPARDVVRDLAVTTAAASAPCSSAAPTVLCRQRGLDLGSSVGGCCRVSAASAPQAPP